MLMQYRRRRGVVLAAPLAYTDVLKDGSAVISGGGIVGANGLPVNFPAPTRYWQFNNSYAEGNGGANYAWTTESGSPYFIADCYGRATQAINSSGGPNLILASNNVPDLNHLGPTWSIFIRMTFINYADWMPLLTADDLGQQSWSLKMLPAGPYNNRLYVSLYNPDPNYYLSSFTPALNQVYEIAIVSDANQLSLLVNGVVLYGPVTCVTPQDTSSFIHLANAVYSNISIWKGTALTTAQCLASYKCWHAVDEAETYARLLAAAPALTKTLNGVITSPASDTWGAEAAGKYSYQNGVCRYHRAAGDLPGNPGGWPQ